MTKIKTDLSGYSEQLLVERYTALEKFVKSFKGKPIPSELVGQYTGTRVTQSVIAVELKDRWGLNNTDQVVSRLREIWRREGWYQ